MNHRERMRFSNKKAREWLLNNGYDYVWLKSHTRRKDTFYTINGGKHKALDLWNLFDGICINNDGHIIFLQIKTNKWPNIKPYQDFHLKTKTTFHSYIMLINVKKVNKINKWEVLNRIF